MSIALLMVLSIPYFVCSISTLTIVLIIKSVYVLVLNRVELRKSRRVAKPYRIAYGSV